MDEDSYMELYVVSEVGDFIEWRFIALEPTTTERMFLTDHIAYKKAGDRTYVVSL